MSVLFCLYVGLGTASVACCIVLNRRFRVVSSFAEVLKEFLVNLVLSVLSPRVLLVGPVVLLFIAAFWPVLCVWDLVGIPRKRRARYESLKQQQTERRDERSNATAEKQEHAALLGITGETVGALCPMGQVRIGGKVWEAKSIAGYIPSAQRILVVGRKGKLLEVLYREQPTDDVHEPK